MKLERDPRPGQSAYHFLKIVDGKPGSFHQRLVARILARPDAKECFKSKRRFRAAMSRAIREEAKRPVDAELPRELMERAKDLEKRRRKTIRQKRERLGRAARSEYEKTFELCLLPKKRPP